MDNKYLDLAIQNAELSFNDGNYPVGAVLTIENELIGENRNTAEKSKNYSQHAETRLILDNAEKMLQAWKDNKEIILYSTLEPCLMCLGVAVMNKVNKIVYIQSDPLAGACSLNVNSLGERYKQTYPEIIKLDYSPKPKEMIVSFLKKQIVEGIRVEWSKNFLKLLE
jgi:tRNA(adenine34) deaminase